MSELTPVKYRDAQGVEVEAVQVVTADDVRAVRALEEWHDGQVRVLTYPTADPVLFVGLEPPLGLLGRQHVPGQYLVKSEAGQLDTMPAAIFAERGFEVAA